MHGPRDVGLGVSDFLDRATVVVCVNAKARCLSLDAALRILETTGWVGLLADTFRANEEFAWTITDPRDADRRMNLVNGRHAFSSLSKSIRSIDAEARASPFRHRVLRIT